MESGVNFSGLNAPNDHVTRRAEFSLSTLAERSAAKRLRLAADWPTAELAGLAMGLDQAVASQTVTRYRKEGKLLGVYMTEPRHHWRYPTWQFDRWNQPIRHVSDVLAILRKEGSFLDEQGKTTGWNEATWFIGGHALLNGSAPCELLRDDPDAVVEAARVEFNAPSPTDR